MTLPQQRTRSYRITAARRPQRQRRLPRITLGGLAGTLIGAYITYKTWPAQTIAVLAFLALLGLLMVLAAVRPNRFVRISRFAQRVDKATARLFKRRPIPRRPSLGRLQAMNWRDFEGAVVARSRQSDYVAHAIGTGKSGDRGCDGIATLNNGARVLIQCKRYKNAKKITGEMVRATDGAMRQAGCDLSTIVTTSNFTPEGQIAAAQLGVIPFNGAATANWFDGGRAPWEPAESAWR